ncbi:hypothetical protein HanRHA438_Chr12g0563361 [Helianthus annuus]|nr:hypothetical protein HanRHA438_Chr12g0563361 [Helianthus annuus]
MNFMLRIIYPETGHGSRILNELCRESEDPESEDPRSLAELMISNNCHVFNVYMQIMDVVG